MLIARKLRLLTDPSNTPQTPRSVEVLTLCFDIKTRGHVSARPKMNIPDRCLVRARSKHNSSMVFTYLDHDQNMHLFHQFLKLISIILSI